MKGTVNLMLGSNPKDKREENDFYATHPHAVEIALPTFEKIGLGGKKKRSMGMCLRTRTYKQDT